MQVKTSEGRGCGRGRSLQYLRDILFHTSCRNKALMRDFLVISDIGINYILKTYQKILQNLLYKIFTKLYNIYKTNQSLLVLRRYLEFSLK